MNFQNIPRDLKVVKRAFVPKLGAFSFFDYQSVEPRLTAYFMEKTGDSDMADRIRSGIDPYTAVAQLITGSTEKAAEERTKWKVTFLSLLYGGGVKTIQLQFGCNQSEARQIIKTFHENLPGVKRLQERTQQAHARRGYIRTPWGRQLHAEEFGEHKLLNKLIQGSAADLMKSALYECDTWRTTTRSYYGTATRSQEHPDYDHLGAHETLSRSIWSHIVSVVHDEIIFDGPIDEVETLHRAIPYLMTQADPRAAEINAVVPLGVDHEVAATSWADKLPYEEWKKLHGDSQSAISASAVR
jgi:DNA polymerase I-like protein with 3'-5' exonuclease and polymerase domains